MKIEIFGTRTNGSRDTMFSFTFRLTSIEKQNLGQWGEKISVTSCLAQGFNLYHPLPLLVPLANEARISSESSTGANRGTMAACLMLQRRPLSGDASCLLKTVSGGEEEELSYLKVHCSHLQLSRFAYSSARKRLLHPSCGGNGCKQIHIEDENVNKLEQQP